MAPNDTLEQAQILCEDKTCSILTFFVNGRKVELSNPDPRQTLLSFLRNDLGLCGTKLGCGEGGCGACTVMVSFLEADGKIRHISVNACLAPVCSLHGMAVVTVEGIGSTKTKLHSVQKAIADAHGSQCGFCTPGIVMSMYTLLRNNPKPKMEDIETYFQGNLCRCTGYRPILEGYSSFAQDGLAKCCGGNKKYCCKNQTSESQESESSSGFQPFDDSQEPIFPPELILKSNQFSGHMLTFQGPEMTWFRPTSLKQLLKLKSQYPHAKLVVGNTELGVEMKFKKQTYPIMIQPTKVPELSEVTISSDGVTFGASVTLSTLEETLREQIRSSPGYKTRIFKQIVEMLRWFAGKQIRNVGSIGGNIITGSPISDLNPIFMASNCLLTLASNETKTNRQVRLDENFYPDYRKTILAPHEVLLSITIPFTQQNELFAAFKAARRRDDDIAIVNGAFFYQLTNDAQTIQLARIAFGGLSKVTKIARNASDFLEGKPWRASTFESTYNILLDEIPLPPGVPGAMVRYRQSLAISFLYKSFLSLSVDIERLDLIDQSEISAAKVFEKEPSKGCQLHEIIPVDQEDVDPLRRPIKHRSADKQACGEAIYVDDIPKAKNEAYLAFVISSKAHAKIKSINPEKALNISGVMGFYSAKDLPTERNQFQMVIVKDEWLLADGEVNCVGQIIALIVAKTQDIALKAADLVEICYEDLKPIITMDEAIAAKSFHKMNFPRICSSIDINKDLKECDRMISGQIRTGAQEHFYMEPQCCLAVPSNEDGEMTVFSSTQNPTESQHLIAHVLGVPMNRVVVKVKRIGGGFGGKETRSALLAMAAAFAASKLGIPVRTCLDRDQDMLMCGQRHPFLFNYKVGFTSEGMLKALDMDMYCNAGYTMDLSFSVVDRAMLHSDNCYNMPKVDIKGNCCKTNLQSNTAFRGFGGPQGLFAIETFMDEIALELNIDPFELREKNLYKNNDTTYFSQKLENCTIRKCWEECKAMSSFESQRVLVEKWNSLHKWKKRGVAMIPVKFGIAFTAPHLNQGGALVHVYTDGSVLLTHGGTEMGQGLHTKTMQVASKVLGIPIEMIHINETSTDKVPNTSPTAASVGSDINGMAVKFACEEICKRLQPYKEKMPDKSWNEWVNSAYMDRISLSATGFYATPNIGYDHDSNKGNPFSYFTYGVAASLVEIDCLTGDHSVLRTDIVMDVGESLNPAIDIGQIEGAFAQGYGLFMMEQMIHSPEGVLLTRGPGAYKLPGFGDMPSEFNVALLRGAPNPRAVFSSKAVGEPPLFLACSVFFAVKEAIKAARAERGLSKKFKLDAPATAEKIRMACEDNLTAMVPLLPPKGSYKPWGIQV